MTIRLRLTLWYTGILAVTLLSLGLAVYFTLYSNLYGNLKKDMAIQGEQVVSQIKPTLVFNRRGGWPSIQFALPPLDYFQTGMVIQFIHSSGEVTKQANTITLPTTDATVTMASQNQKFYESIVIENTNVLIYNIPFYDGKDFYGVLRVAANKDIVETPLKVLKYTFLLIGFFGLLLAASVGWFLARKTLRPIEAVIVAANRIEKSADLDRRIEYSGPSDEIGRLTGTINGMLERIQTMYVELDDAYKAQRRFVSDASHELRTPLTTIRGNVELLEKMWRSLEATAAARGVASEDMTMSLEAMRDISDEAARMSRLVNDLLSLARADAGQTIQQTPVGIKPLVDEVVRRAQFLPRSAEWIVGDTRVLDDIWVNGSKDYLQQLLFIFIENAFKYTDEGMVRLDFIPMERQIGFRITDTGIGMDKEEVPHIFERFYRADVSRGTKAGTGLGLSIAKWIIDEHGGSIEVMTQKEKGTTFVVWLPMALSLPSRG
ncbi:sensor histidine kinase [Paenibacillus koleovorans]|uniref:sensor histidine kinase n=1 Tax=Paenibacillus koleovorans TaxID=121608 RepID=UPI000FDB5226|nr:HAMP domain-containing sensor histidine kinase [Paenibacillus koleovorans]